MKRGQSVAVCYDGKYGRRVHGEIIDMKRDKILVRFNLWASEPAVPIEHWFKKRRTSHAYLKKYFGGFVPNEDSLMEHMFGMPGDWYSVYPWKDISHNE